MIFKSVATLFLLLIFLTPLTSFGQEIERHPKEAYFDFEIGKNDYIKEWLVIGPFPKGEAFDANASPLQSYGGESNIRPYEGMKITAPDGKTLAWKRYRSQTDIINLIDAIGEHEDVVAYAACNIINVGAKHSQNASPLNDSPLEMLIGSDDGVKVWLNGKLIHSNPVERGVTLDEDRLPVKLVKGINPCLIKVDQGSSNWGFALRLIDYQGYLQSINQSLKLELSVRRQKKEKTDGKDVLSITPSVIIPKSTIPNWKAPSLPKSVDVEIRDEASQLLASLKTQIDKAIPWTVPENVQGTLGIIAKYKDHLGKAQKARFTCKAHSVVPAKHQIGHWETYDVTNGLGGSRVWSILQDRNGYLWFGLRENGLCRYDGRSFKTFTKEDGLPSNDVWTIFEDRKGHLWIGTMDYNTMKGAGVCRYNGKTFKTYTTKDGLAGDAVTAIYEDKQGHLWFGTTSYNYPTSGPAGISEFDGKTFRNYTSKDGLPPTWSIGAIIQDKDGNLWFRHGLKNYGGGAGATRYDGKAFRHFTTKDGLVGNGVTSIVADAQGNLWFGTGDGGISKYDGKSFQNFTTADGLARNWVNDLFIAKNGDLWVATGGGGVSRYQDGKFQNFTTGDGLAHNGVMSIAEDREGNLWFGTNGGGTSRYKEL